MSEAVTDPGQDYRQDPGRTGLPIIDALVAAAVETVALRRGTNSPKWTSDPTRVLDHFRYPGPENLVPVGAGPRANPIERDGGHRTRGVRDVRTSHAMCGYGR
ncbi:MAG: hypothetical protein WCF36_16120 [Candidatus Nanopelagicales bacterium]